MTMSVMQTKSLGDFGPYLAMRPLGRQVQDALDAALRALPPGGVLAIDFDGVEMMDYSFADEAIGTIYSRMGGKEYPDRYMVLLVKDDPVSQALLENVEVALAQRDAAAIAVPAEELADLVKLLEADRGKTAKSEKATTTSVAWRVIGKLPEHLIETLGAVMNQGQSTVRDIVDALQLESVTACNNRIARLHQLRLVRRKAAIVPEGGRLYCYSGVF
jgi:predicted transcriptional regulator